MAVDTKKTELRHN